MILSPPATKKHGPRDVDGDPPLEDPFDDPYPPELVDPDE